ncbi:hypothetical protein M8J77_022366 [Diaphorina citri]|nr:hypothetical protein M8J77_022366 [Diaphorina citri]
MEQAKLASQNRSTKENELVLEKEADIDDFAETTKGRQNTLVKAIERRQSKSIKGNPARLETCPRISSAKETEEEYDKPNEMAHEFTHVDGSNIINEPCDVDTKNMIDETSDIDRNAITNETPDDNDVIYESSDRPNDDSSDGEFIDNYTHVDPSVFYTTRNIPGPGIDTDLFYSQISNCCDCTNEETISQTNPPSKHESERCTQNCDCNPSNNYTNHKLNVHTYKLPIYECNNLCKFLCANRVIQNGPIEHLTIFKHPTIPSKGYGVKSTQPIARGEFICEYVGEVIGKDEAKRRYEIYRKEHQEEIDDGHFYIFHLSEIVGNSDHGNPDIESVNCGKPLEENPCKSEAVVHSSNNKRLIKDTLSQTSATTNAHSKSPFDTTEPIPNEANLTSTNKKIHENTPKTIGKELKSPNKPIKTVQTELENVKPLKDHPENPSKAPSRTFSSLKVTPRSSGSNAFEMFIDATTFGNIGRYINHSCEPNCLVVPIRVNCVYPSLAIFAKTDIGVDEEITYDYAGLDEEFNTHERFNTDKKFNTDERFNTDNRFNTDERFNINERFSTNERYNTDERFNTDKKFNTDEKYNTHESFNSNEKYKIETADSSRSNDENISTLTVDNSTSSYIEETSGQSTSSLITSETSATSSGRNLKRCYCGKDRCRKFLPYLPLQ